MTAESSQEVEPVFILSMPRSGSTLLQRMLATHPQIATASEPWVLLPQIYVRRSAGLFSEYHQGFAREGIEDFVQLMPGGWNDYNDELRRFIGRLYGRVAPSGTRYFVDKTPRYSIIAGEIARLFPRSLLIFLWRHPLSMLASCIEFMGGGRWQTNDVNVSLFKGFDELVRTQMAYEDRAIKIRFRDLVTDPSAQLEGVFRRLDLNPSDATPEHFSAVDLFGRRGDQRGVAEYKQLSSQPLSKWQEVINTSYRKAWTRRYLLWLGPDRIQASGFHLGDLLDELDAAPSTFRGSFRDARDNVKNMLGAGLELDVFRAKVKQGKMAFLWGHR